MNFIRNITSKILKEGKYVKNCQQVTLSATPISPFTVYTQKFAQQYQNMLDPIKELYQKKFRQMMLEQTLLQQHKILIPAKRIRKTEDNIVSLKQKNECAGREGIPDIDIVLDPLQIRTLVKRPYYKAESFYINVNGEDIRVTLEDAYFHEIQGWVWGAQFNRYIVGEQNKLTLKIEWNSATNNAHINRGSDHGIQIKEIQVYSYNDDYPVSLTFDAQQATHYRGYKVGDLAALLPDGMTFTQTWRSQLNTNVMQLGPDPETMMNNEIIKQKMLASQSITVQDQQFVELSSNKQKDTGKEKIEKKQQVRSVKQIVAAMTAEEKQSFIG